MHSITKTKDGYDITLTRGDSLFLSLDLKKAGKAYVPDQEATLRFAMKSSYNDPDEDAVLVKDIPVGTLVLSIAPEDTKALTMGRIYVYDIELTDEYGNVDTFLRGKFTIGEEVM